MRKPRQPAPPPAPPAPVQSEFDLAIAKYSADYQARLRGLYEIWKNPQGEKTLKESDKLELIRAGVIPNEKPEPDLRRCNTLTEVARIISVHFKVDCRKQFITWWRKGSRLPSGTPLFPPPDPKSNQFDVESCLAWYEKHILKSANAENDLGRNLVEERDRAELEEIAHARFLRQREIGEYVHRTVALASGVAAVKKIHLMIKAEDERNLPKMRREKLMGLGVPPEVIEVFGVWDAELGRSITDKRELAMEEIGREIKK